MQHPAPRFSRSTAAIIHAVLLICTAGAAHAGDGDPPVRVVYGDLNLSIETDAHVFLSRLNRASRDVCGSTDSPGTARINNMACRLNAIRSGLEQVQRRRSSLHPLLLNRLTQVRR